MGSIVGQFDQDLIIKESSSLIGQVRGNVTVCERVNLQLHGLVVGNLILKSGSEVFLHGTVDGDVINEGGYLTIYGRITGTVHDRAGKTVVAFKKVT